MDIQEQIEPFLRKSNQNVLGISLARTCTNPTEKLVHLGDAAVIFDAWTTVAASAAVRRG